MKIVSTAILLLVIGTATVLVATGQERKPERDWRRLPLIKDGKVDPVWTQIGGGGFAIDDGSLRTECDDTGMGMLLYTKDKFGNCQIRVVLRCKDAKANSGVFIRIDEGVMKIRGEKPAALARDKEGKLLETSFEKLQEASEREQGAWYPVHRGFEVQICETGDEYHRTGAIYSLAKAAPLPKLASDGWRTMVITLNESRVQVDVDGQRVTTFDSDDKGLSKRQKWYEPKREPKRPNAGYIGLQTHDPGDVVWFKEVSVLDSRRH